MKITLQKLADYHFPLNLKNSNNLTVKFVGKNALLVWQYLRFNPSYRKSYDELLKELKTTKSNDEKADILYSFKSGWSMLSTSDSYIINSSDIDNEPITPPHYDEPNLPAKFQFTYTRVQEITARNSLTTILDGQGFQLGNEYISKKRRCSPSQTEPIILAINPMSSIETLTKDIKAILSKKIKSTKDDVIFNQKGTSMSNLVGNLLCYYYREIEPESNREVADLYQEIVATNRTRLKSHEPDEKAKQFRSLSKKSPWCFFEATIK